MVVGEALALTPPLGWNSWNSFDWRVTQAQVETSAGILNDRLKDHGWLSVNVDDAWQGYRGGPHNAIQTNRKFPDMKGMVDKIHALGLRAGIYSSPWMETYAGHIGGSADNAQGTYEWLARADDTQQGGGGGRFQRVGPFSFVANDTRQFAAWGFDYLKYDWNPIDVPNTKIAYDLMRASGRDVVFSLSNGARLAQYSQLWRTSGDMSDTWGAIRQNAFDKAAWAPFQGPGHWPTRTCWWWAA
jgi:alpha-galactosidase